MVPYGIRALGKDDVGSKIFQQIKERSHQENLP